MSSITDKLIDAADIANTVQAGLQVIERVTGGATAHTAISALEVIGAIAKALRAGLSGELHAPDVLAELNKLQTGLAAHDAAAQSELDKKFPTG